MPIRPFRQAQGGEQVEPQAQGKQKITPFLWFDKEAEEAAKFYTSIFKNSKIGKVSRYGKKGFEVHKMPEGTAMAVEFELEGQKFTALNGGPIFKFNESISFVVSCETQEEVDYYWNNSLQSQRQNSAAGLKISSACPGRSSRKL